MNILFLTESREDYLADSLLHGLISLGHTVVDYPRKDILYYSNPGGLSCLRGNGFTLYGLLDDRPTDRSLIIQRLQDKAFDVVILGQVWRQWGQLLDISQWLKDVPTVLLDGDDDNRVFFQSGTIVRRYGLRFFPSNLTRSIYLKRELYSSPRFLRNCPVNSASFSIPSQKVLPIDLSLKNKPFATHCVDAELAKNLSLSESYAFKTEQEYYEDIRSSYFAITTKRGGWDCLRHYEISAAGSVMCFKDLHLKPASCAPFGLIPGLNCLTYSTYDDLILQTESLLHDQDSYLRLALASHQWIIKNTTVQAAQDLINRVSKI